MKKSTDGSKFISNLHFKIRRQLDQRDGHLSIKTRIAKLKDAIHSIWNAEKKSPYFSRLVTIYQAEIVRLRAF